ncbi:MAG TPA: alcohol dehydrogenase catalytic domain-containing protein [Clostridia bacterium]|nr:alcohol dehydrogenase catalytic domain-containing protein [Clostridia bacterium]
MKAAVLRAPGDLVIKNDVPEPVVRLDGQVKVKIISTAVCGTDVSIYLGKMVPPRYPVIQGHESAGIVVEVGGSVRGVAPGDRVVLNPALSCGRCYHCLNGYTNLCENGGLLGRDVDGTFAEYVVVPEVSAIRVPDAVGFDDASTLNAAATVLRGWDRFDFPPGGTVAVIGLGTTGLLHARVAILSGASSVFGITRSRWKLDIAQGFGAIPLNSDDASLRERILEQTALRGVDVAIDTVSSEQTIAQAIDLVRTGGTVLLFGIAATVDRFPVFAVYRKELKILGSRAMNRDGYERAVRLFGGGSNLSSLITHRFELERLAEMFEASHRNPSASLRMVCHIGNPAG